MVECLALVPHVQTSGPVKILRSADKTIRLDGRIFSDRRVYGKSGVQIPGMPKILRSAANSSPPLKHLRK